ncbi:hypothetical protein [Shewanella litorisediminis]|uniref:Lipoprotein n=1 Tax=Shewanella litorisediminis TaxID=1173586 RepID=A0ABX7G1E6_9GAMM|nr:hypothetical protein [Shewanella litorisediminis]MCL2918944.1 hypothetical protein [Shewanella litorisediminis]QRH01013.1 hypothetical protein JQC75_14250 [Shewanella litorisediminis]
MKPRLLYPLLATLLVGACGSDNDPQEPTIPEPPEPPVAEVVHVDEANSIALEVVSFEPLSGAVEFTLKNEAGLAVTGASQYELIYFGLPPEENASRNPKAWKRWHVSQSFRCGEDTSTCEGVLTEGNTKGRYLFEAQGLDWSQDAPEGTLSRYRLAITLQGAKASSDMQFVAEAP